MSPHAAVAERQEIQGPLPGHTMVVDRQGPPDGVPVVFLHGEFGAFPRSPLEGPALESSALEGAAVLSVHLPGWGESQGGDRFERLADMATALWWLLDRLEVATAVLAGHGIGATAAVEMGIQQPGRLRGLCLAAPYGLFLAEDPGLDLFGTLPRDLMGALYQDPEGPVATEHFPAPGDAHERGLASIRRVVVLGAASRYLFPIPDTGIAERLYRLASVPTVVQLGSRDGLVPPSLARSWQDLVPGASVEVLEGAAHMHPYERPDFAAAVGRLAAPGPA